MALSRPAVPAALALLRSLQPRINHILVQSSTPALHVALDAIHVLRPSSPPDVWAHVLYLAPRDDPALHQIAGQSHPRTKSPTHPTPRPRPHRVQARRVHHRDPATQSLSYVYLSTPLNSPHSSTAPSSTHPNVVPPVPFATPTSSPPPHSTSSHRPSPPAPPLHSPSPSARPPSSPYTLSSSGSWAVTLPTAHTSAAAAYSSNDLTYISIYLPISMMSAQRQSKLFPSFSLSCTSPLEKPYITGQNLTNTLVLQKICTYIMTHDTRTTVRFTSISRKIIDPAPVCGRALY